MDSVTCGVRGFCGRPERHRGHHGGWTTGIRAIADSPALHDSTQRLGADLTGRQVKLLAEIVRHGDVKQAAECMGVTYLTAKHLLTGTHVRTGTETTIETLAVLGWLAVPAELGVEHAA